MTRFVLILAAALPLAAADIAVLHTGARIRAQHIEQSDGRYILTTDGGRIELSAALVQSLEHEDDPPPPPSAATADGPVVPLPVIETDPDLADARVVTRVNGEVRQEGRTSQLIFSLARIVAHASQAFTLLPGDVILTGTPAGVGPLETGDTVEVEIDGIGTLTNPVR